MINNLATPMWQMTKGELIDLMKEVLLQSEPIAERADLSSNKYVYGLSGLAQLLGCSKVTAQTIKNSGKIDKAITQIGRKIIVDANLALELAKK